MRMRMLLLALLSLSLTSCSSLGLRQEPIPEVLSGSNQEIRDRLLEQIPVGTPKAQAEKTVRSLGLTPLSEPDPGTGKSLLRCNYTGRTGFSHQTTWLIQIDCPDGTVTDIVCEQIGF